MDPRSAGVHRRRGRRDARVGAGGGLLLGVGYGLFCGIQSAVAFDFHEVAFAPALIAWAALFADRERWRRAVLCVLALLLVKEDLALLVLAFGGWFALQRRGREAIVCLLAGAVWYASVTRELIPRFADGKPFSYWSYEQLGRNPVDALRNAIVHPLQTAKLLVTSIPTIAATRSSAAAASSAGTFLTNNGGASPYASFDPGATIAPSIASGAARASASCARSAGRPAARRRARGVRPPARGSARRSGSRRASCRIASVHMAAEPRREPPSAVRPRPDAPKPRRHARTSRRLANSVHLSRAHFIRSFKATFGETPHRYLQRRRLERQRARATRRIAALGRRSSTTGSSRSPLADHAVFDDTGARFAAAAAEEAWRRVLGLFGHGHKRH